MLLKGLQPLSRRDAQCLVFSKVAVHLMDGWEYPSSLVRSSCLFVVAEDALDDPRDVITIDTLAGGLARRCAEIVRIEFADCVAALMSLAATPRCLSGSRSPIRWLRELRDEWGIAIDCKTYLRDFNALLAARADQIKGFVRVEGTSGGHHRALLRCSCSFTLIVAAATDTMAEALLALGIADVSKSAECRSFPERPEVGRCITFQVPAKARWLGEYSVFAGASSIEEFACDSCDAALGGERGDGDGDALPRFAMGWGAHEGELIAKCSRAGIGLHPSDFSLNLSALNAGACRRAAASHGPAPPSAAELLSSDEDGADQHMVSFMVTDGDNIQWLLDGFVSEENDWFGSATRRRRGAKSAHPASDSDADAEFNQMLEPPLPIGWTIPAALIDLAPCVLRYVQRELQAGESLIAGPSGRSYAFPDLMPRDALSKFAAQSARTMKAAGLTVVTLIFSPECDCRCWEGSEAQHCARVYLQHAEIEALIAFTWGGGYSGWGDGGGVSRIGTKVVIRPSRSLWGHENDRRTPGQSEAHYDDSRTMSGVNGVVNAIGQRPTGLRSAHSYSLIPVHAWTHGVTSIESAIRDLALRYPHVQVVSPRELIQAFQTNVREEEDEAGAAPPPALIFNASTELQHATGEGNASGAWACTPGVHPGSAHMCFGPYVRALRRATPYIASFALSSKKNSKGPATAVVSVDVYDSANDKTLASRVIVRCDFDDARGEETDFQCFELPFATLDRDECALEFRIYWHGECDCAVNEVRVVRG